MVVQNGWEVASSCWRSFKPFWHDSEGKTVWSNYKFYVQERLCLYPCRLGMVNPSYMLSCHQHMIDTKVCVKFLNIIIMLAIEQEGSIVVCVSPLTSLMMDQKAKFSPKGIITEFVGEEQMTVPSRKYFVVLSSYFILALKAVYAIRYS